jgi:hypothetical protein
MDEMDKVLVDLQETPRRITALTGAYPREQLHTRPAPDAWSAVEILAHLRTCADVWGKSILAMIAQDYPTLRYVSPLTWLKKMDYPTLEFAVSLASFARQRDDLLQVLKALTRAEWSRGATFTGTVRGKEHTVLSYAQRIAEHERQHLE